MAHRSRKKHVKHMHEHGAAAGETHGHATDLHADVHEPRERPTTFMQLVKGLVGAVVTKVTEKVLARPRKLVEDRVVAPVRARVEHAKERVEHVREIAHAQVEHVRERANALRARVRV